MSGRGQRFLDSLRDGRTIWLGNQLIDDVAAHWAFSGTLRTLSRLFDALDDPQIQGHIGFISPATGQHVHNSFLIPTDRADLARRNAAFTYWARQTHGIMSRLSDYARSLVTGWYLVKDHMRKYDTMFADKIVRYYEEARDHDRFLTTALLDPQIDRGRGGEHRDPDSVLRIVQENEEGVVVRGAKMVATGGPYAHDFVIFPYHRVDDVHPEYAHALIVPANSKGLHIICREPFSSKDRQNHPLSARYDEMDAVLVFDDVLVPWERVLLKGDPGAVWALRTHLVPNALAYHQTVVRAVVKLEFVTGIGLALAEAIGVNRFLHIQEKLGELLLQLESVRALVLASEADSHQNENGYQVPSLRFIETARNLVSRYYPRAIEILQQIGAGGFVQLPASLSQFNGPISSLLNKYFSGANIGAEDKARLFKLAWDLIGSPLGSRHELYERFYAGDPVRLYANQYLNYDHRALVQPVWEAIRAWADED